MHLLPLALLFFPFFINVWKVLVRRGVVDDPGRLGTVAAAGVAVSVDFLLNFTAELGTALLSLLREAALLFFNLVLLMLKYLPLLTQMRQLLPGFSDSIGSLVPLFVGEGF